MGNKNKDMQRESLCKDESKYTSPSGKQEEKVSQKYKTYIKISYGRKGFKSGKLEKQKIMKTIFLRAYI